MRHAATEELYSYWDRLRGERMAPERSEVDPGAVRGILADTFVLDTSDFECARMRIVGARISALFCGEMTNTEFYAMWRPECRQRVRELIAAVMDDPIPALAGVSAAPAGRAPLAMELLLLPMRHFGKTHTRILGCMSPASLPPWLGLLPVSGLSLGSVQMLYRSQEPAGQAFGTREAHQTMTQRHGHLRVHQGGSQSEKRL